MTTCPALEGRTGPPFKLPPIVYEGNRNDLLTRRAGALRHWGAPEREIRRVLLLENERRCVPPLEPREVAEIARSIAKKPPCVDAHSDDVARGDPFGPHLPDPPELTWGRPPRNLLNAARRRGSRLVDRVSVVDLRRSLFNVDGRRGGGPFRVDLGGSPPSCSCRWWGSKRNLTGTCAHVEASRAFVRLRYGPLEGPGPR